MPTYATTDQYDYSKVDDVCYSDAECASYKKAAAFLGVDNPMEDWGGGTGFARHFFHKYKNIDGSKHKNVDKVADLTAYTSKTENILIRQVLESNPEWGKILTNAVNSFSKKLCLILCPPFVDTTRLGPINPIVSCDGAVSDTKYFQEMYFAKQDILNYFPPNTFRTSEEVVATNQYYNQDWILYVERI